MQYSRIQYWSSFSSFFMVIAFVVFQNRSNFFSGIPPFQYLLQITLTYSTSNSSPTHSLRIPLFLSPLHLYIITDNHSRPFRPYPYHVRVTQLPSFRSTNNLYIFANHEITHFACSFPILQNTPFSSTPPPARFLQTSFSANMHLYHSIHLSIDP